MRALTITRDNLADTWDKVLLKIRNDKWRLQLNKGEPEIPRPGMLVLRFPTNKPKGRAFCEQPSRVAGLESVLEQMTGTEWTVRIRGPKEQPPESNRAQHDETGEVGLNNCFFKTERTTVHDELRFRSPAEIAIYCELSRRDLLVFPNPAAVIGGEDPKKREPDFLIFDRKGRSGILEVMGRTFHTDATKDHTRARLFKRFGILIVFETQPPWWTSSLNCCGNTSRLPGS
jgi:hypothetical protein